MTPAWRRLIKIWREVLNTCRRYNLKIKLSKVVLVSDDLIFLGRRLTTTGIQIDPTRTRALEDMPMPRTVADCMKFYHSAAWSRSFIPRFAEIFAPIKSVIEERLQGTKRTTRAAERMELSTDDIHRLRKPLTAAKRALGQAMTKAVYNPKKIIVIMTDASEQAWAGTVHQCPTSDRDKPLHERDLEPLATYSGMFAGAQKAWTIPCKEAFAIIETINKAYAFTGQKFQLFTDSRNLYHIYGTTLKRDHFVVVFSLNTAAN